MKIAMSLFTTFALIGAALAARLITEGLVLGLVSTAIEQGWKLRLARRR